jgi:hypothetical protein
MGMADLRARICKMTLHSATGIENRLRTALELCDLGEELVEQRLRRENPSVNNDAIRKMIVDWYATRPGAEQGDAIGKPGVWPRNAT